MNPQRCALTLLLVLVITVSPVSLNASRATDERPFLELSRPERGKVFAIAWSPDGQYIAVGTEQGLWIYTDTFADVTHADDKPIHALTWSPDGKTIATGYFGKEQPEPTLDSPKIYLLSGGGLRLWSAQKTADGLRLMAGAWLIRDGSVYSLHFNANGSRLAALLEDAHDWEETLWGRNRLQIFEVASVQRIYDAPASQTTPAQSERITQAANALDWSVMGRLSVAQYVGQEYGAQISIIDTRTDNYAIATYPTAIDRGVTPNSIGWNADGTQYAISAVQPLDPDRSGGIRVCKLATENAPECAAPPLDRDSVDTGRPYGDAPTLAWHPRNALLAYSEGTVIHLWDADRQLLIADLDAAHATVTMLAWKPDGAALLSAGSDYVVRLWTRFEDYQTPDPTPARTVRLPPTPWGETSPDGQWRTVPTEHTQDDTTRHIKVVSTADGHTQATVTLTNVPVYYRLVWSPDSTMLISAISSFYIGDICATAIFERVQLWSAMTGDLLLDLGSVSGVAWRADGYRVAVGKYITDEVAAFEIREVPSGKLLQTSAPSSEWGERYQFLQSTYFHNRDLSVAAWSPDGRLVAIDERAGCGEYGPTSVKLWDVESNAIVGELTTLRSPYGGSEDQSSVAAWSPDGALIAVYGFSDQYLYRLRWEEARVIPEIVWQPPQSTEQYADWDWGTTLFSPDSRYFVHRKTVIDTRIGWPVYKFRNTLRDFDEFRWEGDMFIAVKPASETTAGRMLYVHTSDFLPQ